MKEVLTQHQLKSVLIYYPDTGEFRWSVGRPGASLGSKAGRVNSSGYVEIGVLNGLYRAHRLAFLYMTGAFPENGVDHINRDRMDNRWSNLRECDQSKNMANVEIRSNNTSGFPGVVWDKQRSKWRAQIRIDGKKKNLGRFDIYDDAVNAVRFAAVSQWGEFAGWAK